MVSIIPLLSIAGWTFETIVASSLILVIALISGLVLYSNHLNIFKRLIRANKQTQQESLDFYRRILSVWAKQINTSRQIGDNAVAELTVIFGDIVSRLGIVIETTSNNVHDHRNKEDGILDIISMSQADFQSAFSELKNALQTANDSKALIVDEVNNYSSDMKDIAENAQKMALRSQIIALNAQVEAARAGEHGRAFGVVVGEMRELSRRSAETSSMMSKKVKSIDAVMEKYHEDEIQMSEMEAKYVSNAESLFKNVVERFSTTAGTMEESIEVMENESHKVRNDISSALVALQFQDRLSQVLQHVSENISDVSEISRRDINNLDANAWLKNMETKYTVDEEYKNINRKHAASVENNSLLTFF